MQKFIREVICDCCGDNVNDLFGGYVVKRIDTKLYDICNDCMEVILGRTERYQMDMVEMWFNNKDGRDVGDGDKSEE